MRAPIALILLLAWPGVARGQENLPPVAMASVSVQELLVGEETAFTSAGSLDLDESPEPLSFRWDFGDGATSDLPDPTHAYASAGAHRATLTVSDGASTAIAGVTVVVLAPPTPTAPAASAPLALGANGDLWIVNPDSASISLVRGIDRDELELVREIRVGRSPRTIAIDAEVSVVLVACQGSNEIWSLGVDDPEVASRVSVGHEPYGVAVSPTGGRIVVTNEGDDTVTILTAGTVEPEAVIPVADGPRAIALTADGSRAYITHYLTRGAEGTVTVLDLASSAVLATISLAEDPGPDTPSSGRGFPNLLSAIALDPSGQTVWVGGLKSNTSRGLHVDGQPLTPENWVRGLLAPVDAEGAVELIDRRIDTNDADSVTGIAFSPRGRYAVLAHQGLGAISIYDLGTAPRNRALDGAAVPFMARLAVGDAPQGVVLTADGQRALVTSLLSRTVTLVDISRPQAPVVVAEVSTTEEPLEASVANGKRLFYRSGAPVHSRSGYIACASCHADGGRSDGRTWDFTQKGEGLRNTKDLRGRAGLSDGPLHWSANFDEVQDFENDIVNHFGGTGLARDGRAPQPPLGAPNAGRSSDLDDLAAYVTSLDSAPSSPLRATSGAAGDAARSRGAEIFARVGCVDCHTGPDYTDSVLAPDPRDWVLHDIGTLDEAAGDRLGEPLLGLDTPSLRGLWDSAPYLHDGRAATLRDVLRTGLKDRLTARLSDAEVDDLVAFLGAIDGPGPSGGARDGGCATVAGEARPMPFFAPILLAPLLLRLRARRRPLGAGFEKEDAGH